MSLFEEQTFENLLDSALDRVDISLDKREGSMIYNAIAPSMAELAQLYTGLDFVFKATYLSTAPRDYLIERAKERGLSPMAASAAVFRAEFNIEVPIGSRFSCEDFNFIVTERMADEDTETTLSYKVTCETVGSAANDCAGDLIPVDYIADLSAAKLVELIIPGDDEEDTEIFRKRVLDAVQNQAFGGNQADYKSKVLDIDGVSAVKVHPVWNADTPPSGLIPSAAVKTWYEGIINTITDKDAKTWLTSVYTAALNKKLTVGGTIKLVIMAANNAAPSDELIDIVQTAIDPTQNAGEGLGLAPIGHVVKVEGVTPMSISVNTHLTFKANYNWNDAKDAVNTTVRKYFDEISAEWGSENGLLIVRISQIESRILSDCAAYIADIDTTKLNNDTKNITLDVDSIPILASGGVVNA